MGARSRPVPGKAGSHWRLLVDEQRPDGNKQRRQQRADDESVHPEERQPAERGQEDLPSRKTPAYRPDRKRRPQFEANAVVGLFLQSGYALPPSQPHHRVSSRLMQNLTLFVAQQARIGWALRQPARLVAVLPHPRMLLSDHVVASAKCSRGSLLLQSSASGGS